MNYADLTELIKRYCENEESSFVANIPSFVRMAEQRIYNTVPMLAARKNTIGTTTYNRPYLTLPTDWLATHSAALISPSTLEHQYLMHKEVEFIREAFPVPNNMGVPQYYANYDYNSLILGPTPDGNYQIELHYFAYPESIVTAGTTWLGNTFDNLLLYGALREAYLYMKGEQDMVNYYEEKYKEGVVLLKNLTDTRVHRDDFRSAQNRSQ